MADTDLSSFKEHLTNALAILADKTATELMRSNAVDLLAATVRSQDHQSDAGHELAQHVVKKGMSTLVAVVRHKDGDSGIIIINNLLPALVRRGQGKAVIDGFMDRIIEDLNGPNFKYYAQRFLPALIEIGHTEAEMVKDRALDTAFALWKEGGRMSGAANHLMHTLAKHGHANIIRQRKIEAAYEFVQSKSDEVFLRGTNLFAELELDPREKLLSSSDPGLYAAGKRWLEKRLESFKKIYHGSYMEEVQWALNLSRNFGAKATNAQDDMALRSRDILGIVMRSGFRPLDVSKEVNLNGGIVIFRDDAAREAEKLYAYNSGENALQPVNGWNGVLSNWKGAYLGRSLGIVGPKRYEPLPIAAEVLRQLRGAASEAGKRVPQDIAAALETAGMYGLAKAVPEARPV